MEAGAISAPQAVFFGAVQDVEPGIFPSQFVRQLAGAVGRVIIHHEHVHRHRQAHDPLRQRRQIVLLVVGRDDNNGFLAHKRSVIAHTSKRRAH